MKMDGALLKRLAQAKDRFEQAVDILVNDPEVLQDLRGQDTEKRFAGLEDRKIVVAFIDAYFALETWQHLAGGPECLRFSELVILPELPPKKAETFQTMRVLPGSAQPQPSRRGRG